MDAIASASTHLKYRSIGTIKNFLIPDVGGKRPRISISQVENGQANTIEDNSAGGALEDLENS